MTTDEQIIPNDEVLSREIAKKMIRQQQAVKFLGKKVAAVGLTVGGVDQLLEMLKNKGVTVDDKIAAIFENQKQLSDLFSTLDTSWREVSKEQTGETDLLGELDNILDQQRTNRANSLTSLNKKVSANHENSIHDIEVIKNRLAGMSNQLHGLDTLDQLKSFSQAVVRLAAEVEAIDHQRKAHQTSINQHLTLLTAVADLLTKSIDHYDTQLNVLTKQVKKIDLTIDAIDDHLDDLTPRDLDMSKNDILAMFKQVKPVIEEPVKEPAIASKVPVKDVKAVNATEDVSQTEASNSNVSAVVKPAAPVANVPQAKAQVVTDDFEKAHNAEDITNDEDENPITVILPADEVKDDKKSVVNNKDEDEVKEQSEKKHFWSRWLE